MKLPKNKKPEACAETNGIRFRLKNLHLNGDRLYATNGRVIVSIKVEVDPIDRDGAVSVRTLTLARKTRPESDLHVLLKKKVEQILDRFGKTVSWNPRPEDVFPKEYNQVFTIEPCHHRVAMNAKYVAQISSAFGNDELIFEFPENPSSPIRVVPWKRPSEDFAVLMPLKIEKV